MADSELELHEAIVRDVRNLIAEFDTMRVEVEELKVEIERAERELMEAKGELRSQVKHAGDQLARLIDELASEVGLVDAAGKLAKTLADKASASIDALEQDLGEAQTTVIAASETLKEAVSNCGELAKQCQHDTQTAAAEANEAVSQSLSQARERFTEETQTAMTGFENGMAQTKAAFSTAVHEGADVVGQQREALEIFLDKTLVEQHGEIARAFEEAAQLLGENNVQQIWVEFRRAMKDKAEKEVKKLIDQLLELTLECIDEMEEELNESLRSSSAERQLLEPVFQQIERLKPPIEATIDNVKSICSTVGISV